MRLVTGARIFYTKLETEIHPIDTAPRTIEKSFKFADDYSIDWIAGVNYEHWFNQDWGIALSFDTVITGDNDIDRNLQVFGVYRFSNLHNIWIGYRQLTVGSNSEKDNEVMRIKFTQSGPALGWTFTF